MRFFVILSSALIFTACGLDKGPHYTGDKSFGQDPNAIPLQEPNEPNAPPPPSENPPEPGTEPGTEQPPTSSGHDLLGSYNLVGYFNSQSASRIIRGSGPEGEVVNDGLLDPVLKGLLRLLTSDDSKEHFSIDIRENVDTHHQVTQVGQSKNGDLLGGLVGKESESGKETLDFALSPPSAASECPSPFICVDRVVWQPVKGQTWTYCFTSLDGKPVTVPFAPNPQFTSESFKAALPNRTFASKPFWASSHSGVVTCGDRSAVTVQRNVLQWNLELGDGSRARQPGFMRKAIYKPLKIDTEIAVSYNLYSTVLKRAYQPKGPPFIDQISRFNSRVRYFLNNESHTFVKIERTFQKPFDLSIMGALAALTGGQSSTAPVSNLVGGIASELSSFFRNDRSTTGLQVTYMFEFCGHRGVSSDRFDHCTGRTQP